MKMTEIKDKIIIEFLQFKGLRDVAQIDEFIERIEVATGNGTNTDSDLMYIVLALRANREECTTGDFLNCRAISKPIFEWLSGKLTLSYLDIVIFSTVVYHADTYKAAHILAQKAIEELKFRHTHEKKQKSVIYTILMNMTFRLLRAKYFDTTDPDTRESVEKDIQRLFARYLKDIRSSLDEKHYKTILRVLDLREALFDNNCEAIIEYLEDLRFSADKSTYHAMRSECVEYLGKLKNISTPLYNIATGSRIGHYRALALKTAAQLADHLGTTHSVVNDFEAGRSGIGLSRLYDISKFLGVKMSTLLGEDDVPADSPPIDPFLTDMAKITANASKQSKDYILVAAKQHLKFVNALQNNNDSDTDNEE